MRTWVQSPYLKTEKNSIIKNIHCHSLSTSGVPGIILRTWCTGSDQKQTTALGVPRRWETEAWRTHHTKGFWSASGKALTSWILNYELLVTAVHSLWDIFKHRWVVWSSRHTFCDGSWDPHTSFQSAESRGNRKRKKNHYVIVNLKKNNYQASSSDSAGG